MVTRNKMTKTFSLEESLPNLVVPNLEETIKKYLYSVKAVATRDEYNHTKEVCKEFMEKGGPYLQAKLKKRKKVHRNWVEEIWLDNGYLELRMPLHMINFSGACTYHERFWPLQNGTQIERAAFDLHASSIFWKMLVNEEVEPHRNSRGNPFSMHQLRTAFNTCRIPHRGKDELMSCFKTASEGSVPSHGIVICSGHLFKIDLLDSQTGKPYSPPQFEKALHSIVNKSDATEAQRVAALTALDRDTWADLRDHLIRRSEKNRQNLHDIETSVFVVSLDDVVSEDFGDLMYNALTGDAAQRWRDKSYTAVWSTNGGYASCVEHSAVDGMVMIMFNEFVLHYVNRCGGKWNTSSDIDEGCLVEELTFDLDKKLTEGIERGREGGNEFKASVDVICPVFEGVGKVELQKISVYPETFLQICLHLTYMKLFGKPACTYATATTRQFYHGRTETCRTCIPEVVDFCRAFISQKPDQDLLLLLQDGYDKLYRLMRDCQDNKGCDRHLYGLSLAAIEEGIPLPKIFTDPMYTKTGGNGNFILSTSFVGFFNSSGAVCPMVEDGIGMFSRMNDHRIVITLTQWRKSKEIDVEKFRAMFGKVIPQVFQLFQLLRKSKL